MAVTRHTLRLLAGMRIRLGDTVDQATRDLVRAWAQAWDTLQEEWDTALDQLIARSQDGQWPSRAQIYRADRVLRALDATEQALTELVDNAGARMVRVLPTLTDQAAEWQARLVAAQLPPVAGDQTTLTGMFNRVDPGQLGSIVTRTTEQITSLSRPLTPEAMQAVHRSLIRGVALGENPREAGRRMVRAVEGHFNGGLSRATTIARTEMLEAHRNAAHAQDLANTDTLTGWKWMATLATSTCMSCLSQHGQLHEVAEPGPYDHQNGRCVRLPVSKSWRELGFNLDDPPDITPDARAWFDQLPNRDQLAMMGPERYDLFQSGQIGWDDLTQLRHSPAWRDSYGLTPVNVLRQNTAA